MENILWLAVLFVGLPFLLIVLEACYDIGSAKDGTCGKGKIWAFEILGLILLVWAFVEWAYHYRLSHEGELYFLYLTTLERITGFSSVKLLVLFLLKFVTGAVLNVFTVIAVSGRQERKRWEARIEKALNGPLGERLKSLLPSNSRYYYVGDQFGEHVIEFYEGGQLKSIPFSSLGYKKFPERYADFFCRWIQDHIVSKKDMYRLEIVVNRHTEWVGGSPDYIETTRTSTGFKSRHVSGDRGTEVTTVTIRGYKLKYVPPEEKQKPKLKDW